MRFSSSFSLTRFAQRNTTTSTSKTNTRMPNSTAKIEVPLEAWTLRFG